jgi:capsid protein
MIDTTRYDDKKNLFNGIQRDRDGRITGIYLYKTQERRESALVSMTELEYFSPVWISLSQYTAVTQLATVLPTLNKLDQYTDAELQAALNRAKNGKYWRTALYDDLMKIVRAQQEEETRKQQLTTLLERISEKGVKADGLTPIPLSDDVLRIDEPSASVFPNLAKNAKQNIAAGAGSASQLVYRDGTDANYSSLKGILGMVGIEWDTRFNDLTEEIVDFILSRAVRAGVAAGKLTIPDFWLDPDEYTEFDYMRNATIDIEPLKTANANAKNYETGSVSLTEICRRGGRDVEDVLRERISEQLLAERIRKELGAAAPSEPEGGIDNGTS